MHVVHDVVLQVFGTQQVHGIVEDVAHGLGQALLLVGPNDNFAAESQLCGPSPTQSSVDG